MRHECIYCQKVHSGECDIEDLKQAILNLLDRLANALDRADSMQARLGYITHSPRGDKDGYSF